MNTPIHRVEARCQNCGKWFPPAIQAGDFETFESCVIDGQQQCPNCGQMTPIGKEYVRFLREDKGGGWTGDESSTPSPRVPLSGDFTDQEFTDALLQLDGSRFTRCTFTRCWFIYTGTGPIHLGGCTFDVSPPRVSFAGAAAHTIEFLASAGQSDLFRSGIEDLLQQIASGKVDLH